MANEKPLLLKGLSDTGKVRELNEDSFGTAPALQIGWGLQEERGTLVAVADGMGGHAAGEVASRLAIDALFKSYYTDTGKDLAKALVAGFNAANTQVHDAASIDSSKTSMGSTLVAAVVKDGKLYAANVGDSRLYLVRRGKIRQITHDHSWVAEQVRAHVLTEGQAENNVYKNIITRAIGNRADVKVDSFREQLKANDVIVLGSDGLTNKVASNEIAAIVSSTLDPDQAAQKLIAQANQLGGDDNITAIVLRLPGERSALPVFLTAAITLALLGMAAYLILSLVFQQAGIFRAPVASTPSPTLAPISVPTVAGVGMPTSSPSPTATFMPEVTITAPPTSTPTLLLPTNTPTPTISPTLTVTTENETTTGVLSSILELPGAVGTIGNSEIATD